MFGEVKVGADGVAVENTEAIVVAVGDVFLSEQFRDAAFALGLDEGAVFGTDGFLEFDFGFEVSAVEADFIEAGIAEGSLKGAHGPGVFVWGEAAAAATAGVDRLGVADTHGFADRGAGAEDAALYVVFFDGVFVEVAQVREGGFGICAVGGEGFGSVLAGLGVFVLEEWKKGLYGCVGGDNARQLAEG